MEEEEFELQLGKMRAHGSKRGKRYAHQLVAAVNRAGGAVAGKRKGTTNIGRGRVYAAILSNRDQFAAFRHRRVVVKARIVKLKGKGIDQSKAHLRYIQRDGVTREGERGELYSTEHDRTDAKEFMERSQGDRHQFRFIVAPEDGAEYEDLKSLTRRLLAQMEEDLGTRLDWVAVDHFNTGNPHTHILVRGKDDRGKDLVIAPSYIHSGIRERAAQLVYIDLGQRTDFEIDQQLREELSQERLTSLDKRLLQRSQDDGTVMVLEKDSYRQTLLTGRLKYLQRLGLANELKHGQWQLAEGLEGTLRRMGEHNDIIKTMHRVLKEAKIERSASDYVLHEPEEANTKPVIGRVMSRGLSDEISDRHYLIVDGIDGCTHYIDIGSGDLLEPTPQGSIVNVEHKSIQPKPVDHAIIEVAAANGGQYSLDIHLRHDPYATEAYVETHIRRLEAIRKVTGALMRETNGMWQIGQNYLEHVKDYERKQSQRMPVIITKLSNLTLGQQIETDGATWLDRQMVSKSPEPLRDSGFGQEVKEAIKRRQQWLVEQDLARREQDQMVYTTNMLAVLERRELSFIATKLSEEMALPYVKTGAGERVEGLLRQSIELASSKYALIEKSHEFTLVPWRQVLERHIGKHVSGLMRADGSISWTIGRQRGVGIE